MPNSNGLALRSRSSRFLQEKQRQSSLYKAAEMGSGPFGLLAYRQDKWEQLQLIGNSNGIVRIAGQNKTEMASVMVTGANRGIGLGLVREFLKTDQTRLLIATCRDPEQAEELKNIKDPRLRLVKLEVTCDKSIQACYDEVEKIVGSTGLNMLVNNAGILLQYSTNEKVDRSIITKQLDINIASVVILSQLFLPLLKRAANTPIGAKLINISSELGSMTHEAAEMGSGPFGLLAYRLSKAAMNSMTKCMSIDLAADGIITASYAPGWIQTDLGGPQAPLKVEDSVPHLVKTFYALRKEQSGGYFNRFGEVVPY